MRQWLAWPQELYRAIVQLHNQHETFDHLVGCRSHLQKHPLHQEKEHFVGWGGGWWLCECVLHIHVVLRSYLVGSQSCCVDRFFPIRCRTECDMYSVVSCPSVIELVNSTAIAHAAKVLRHGGMPCTVTEGSLDIYVTVLNRPPWS